MKTLGLCPAYRGTEPAVTPAPAPVPIVGQSIEAVTSAANWAGFSQMLQRNSHSLGILASFLSSWASASSFALTV